MQFDPTIFGNVAIVGAWLWSEFGKDIVKFGASSVWRKFRFNEAKQKYQSKIKEMYSNMRVLYKFETVSLEKYYVDLFVLEEPEAHRRYGVEYLESNFDEKIGLYNRGTRTDALVVVRSLNRLFVLGKPGSGKTTFLKYLASLTADEKEIDRVPVFISFNNWAYSQKNLIDYIVDQFDVCGFPDAILFIESLLENGRCLLLFDGLDEVKNDDYQKGRMINEIENLIFQYHYNNKIIITCRNAGNEYKFENFNYVEIADFSDIQAQTFVEKWFEDKPEKAKKFHADLIKDENQRLKDFSHNPLLLGMLCLVYEEKSLFPEKRGLIYKEAIDALTKKWDQERGVRREKIPGFSPSFEKNFLSLIAYQYLMDNKVYFDITDIAKKFKKGLDNKTLDHLDIEEILPIIEVQHGLLAQRAIKAYSFSHLTFHEYFAAQYIIDHLDSKKEILTDLFAKLHSPRWHEVFPLVAGLIEDPTLFFKKFLLKIREPIKRNKVLTVTVKNLEKLGHKLNPNGDIVTIRMQALATTIAAGKIINLIKKATKKHNMVLTRKMLHLLEAKDIDVSIEDAYKVALLLGRSNISREERQSVYKFLRVVAGRHLKSQDAEMSRLDKINFDQIRTNLRDQLKKFDVEHKVKTIENIQYDMEKTLFIGLSLQIVLDFNPNFIGDFIHHIEKIDFPGIFATEDEWNLFYNELITASMPLFDIRVSDLNDESLSDLETFLKSNIFLLDCFVQANVSKFPDYVFSLKPYKST